MESHLVTLEAFIKGQQLPVKRQEALNRLRKNKDFQELIVQGYLHNEAARVTSLLCTPEFPTNETLHRRLEAISLFTQFLDIIDREAEIARNQILEAEEEREAILNGEYDNE